MSSKIPEAPQKSEMSRLIETPEVVSWRALMNAFQNIYRHLEDELQSEGCSYPRFQLLFIMYFEGPRTPVALSQKMFVSRSNMSMFLKRMLADKLVMVCPMSTSMKRPAYILTRQGIEFFEKHLPGHIERITKRVPDFGPRQLAILRKLALT